ncbi:MAG: acyl-CoA thioesterase [Anaerolineae bacterium]
MTGRTVEARLRVRYAETDAMGYVYHGNYFVWFEVGRSEYYRVTVGEDPGDFFRRFGMPVIEASARYHSPCRYDDAIVVATRVADLKSRALRFEYEIRREDDGALLTTGQTTHVCVDGSGKPCRIPGALQRALAGEASD